MAWVGPRYKVGVIDPPYFSPGIGAPDNGLVPQWPTPDSRRTGGLWRWITEPLRRPMTQRLLCRIDYSANEPAAQGGEYDFTEFCWVGLFMFDDFHLAADSGVSPWGTRLQGEIRIDQEDVGLLPADVTEAWTLTTPRGPPVELAKGHGQELLWNKPPEIFLFGPAIVCPVCTGGMSPQIGVSVDGVTASPPVVDLRDSWANGTYDLNRVSGCSYRRAFPSPAPFQARQVDYELTFREGTIPVSTGQVHLLCQVYENGFDGGVTGSCEFASADIPLVSGKFNCFGSLPVLLAELAGTNVPGDNWNWGGSTISAVLPGGGEGGLVDSFPWKRVQTYGFSECYPIETFTAPDPVQGDEFVDDSLAGVFILAEGSQNINAGIPLVLQAPLRQVGGVWWDPGGTKDFVTVVDPFNFVKLTAGMMTGIVKTGSIDFYIRINSANDYDGVARHSPRSGTIAQLASVNCTTGGWIPVTAGDTIDIWARQNNGENHSDPARTWLQVEAAFHVV